MAYIHDDDSRTLVARFDIVRSANGQELILHSAGGSPSAVSGAARNFEYPRALELLLERLGRLDAILVDAWVDSTRVQSLPVDDRRLVLADRTYPLALAPVDDFDALRRALTRAQSAVGRAPNAKIGSGGNERKRIRLRLYVPGFDPDDQARLELALSATQSAASPPIVVGRAGQGFMTDAAARDAVEQHAMTLATEYFTSKGWSVRDVSKQQSYDLLCQRSNGEELRVEVKGTTTPGGSVLLTPNEVAHALSHGDRVALYVVSNIKLDDAGDAPRAFGGDAKVQWPWRLRPEQLAATGYSYLLDG